MTLKHLLPVLTALVLLLTAWSTASAAAPIEVSGSGLAQTIACGDQDVVLGGSVNTITLTGACPKIEITGSRNVITVEAVGAIEINGTANSVGWSRSLGGATPRVGTTGLGNRVFRADAPPPAEPVLVVPAEPVPVLEPSTPLDVAPVTLLDSGIEQTLECQDGSVDLLGSGNRLTLVGTCHEVRVAGSANQVWVQRVTSIEVTGSASTVTWQDGPDDSGTEPAVSVLGVDSSVTQGPLP
jgi:Protein of unknown function (DUF3060)